MGLEFSATALARVETVRGAIPVAELGIVLPHEHLLIDAAWPFERHDFDIMLDNEDLAIRELSDYRAAGGSTLVELSHASTGRDPMALRRISEASDVHVVMGCGWYRQPYYGAEVDESSVADLATVIVNEVQHGVGETGIRPGIIGEIGSHKGYVTAQEERVFRAAGRAALATGLAVTTHSVPDLKWTQRRGQPVGLAHLEILGEEGLAPDRIIIGHCDSWLHADYHHAVAARGAYVQFDNVGCYSWLGVASVPAIEDLLLDQVKSLVEAGFGDRILLSQDIGRKSTLKAYGGNGYDYLLTTFVTRMGERGISPDIIDLILRENPRRVLTPQAT